MSAFGFLEQVSEQEGMAYGEFCATLKRCGRPSRSTRGSRRSSRSFASRFRMSGRSRSSVSCKSRPAWVPKQERLEFLYDWGLQVGKVAIESSDLYWFDSNISG